MDRKMFDDAIGEPPPSTVRVDEAIARGRRAARIRQVAAPTVGVATAVVLVIGAAAFAVTPDNATAPPATASSTPPSPPPSPTSTETCGPDGTEPPTSEPVDVAKQRLTDLARDLVGPRLPPEAHLASGLEGDEPLEFFVAGGAIDADDTFDELACDPDRHYTLTGLADVDSADGRSGLLSIHLSARQQSVEECPTNEKLTDQPVCDVTAGPNGERVQVRTDVLNGSWVENVVWVAKPDGTFVSVTSAKGRVVGSQQPWSRPPLSLDQLREIALDPGMTLFP